MSRRRRPQKREILPDAKYGDLIIAKFMNCLMYEGKKSVTEHIVYGRGKCIDMGSITVGALSSSSGTINRMTQY